MIKQVKAHRQMPEELYSSRSCLTAILVAINRRFVINIFKQKHRSWTIVGIDAAQCYDRIVHSLSILLCPREDAHASSLMMMFDVIQCMIYFIRTSFGDSTTSYGGLQDITFQGSCQGNGACPGICLVIYIYKVLFMKEEGRVSQV